MTVTGHLGYMPDLTRLYERCSFIPYWWVGEGIVKIQYGDNAKGICTDDILHTSTKTKKRFFNQSSLVFRLLFEGVYKETNIKMFKNGGFQCAVLGDGDHGGSGSPASGVAHPALAVISAAGGGGGTAIALRLGNQRCHGRLQQLLVIRNG